MRFTERERFFTNGRTFHELEKLFFIGTESGVVADTYGIVEYESGVVERVIPCDIQFLDNKFADYCFDDKEEE